MKTYKEFKEEIKECCFDKAKKRIKKTAKKQLKMHSKSPGAKIAKKIKDTITD